MIKVLANLVSGERISFWLVNGHPLAVPSHSYSSLYHREQRTLMSFLLLKRTPILLDCLENPRDRGAWWAAVCGVAQNWTRLKRCSSGSSSLQLHLTLITSKGSISRFTHIKSWGFHIKIGVGRRGDTIQTTTTVTQRAMFYHHFLIIVTVQ